LDLVRFQCLSVRVQAPGLRCNDIASPPTIQKSMIQKSMAPHFGVASANPGVDLRKRD